MQKITVTSEQLQNQKECQSLVVVFRAKTSPLMAMVTASMEQNQDYGAKCLELFGSLDLATSSLKTVQLSLFEDSSGSYASFPSAGMMHNGKVYRMQNLDTHIGAKGYTLLLTPTASDRKKTFSSMEKLHQYLRNGHQNGNALFLFQKGFSKKQIVTLLELMMGFPIGHTELKR